ncbi:fimbrial biogenesis chaperone, partial [Escherichia coli]|uniref:fimbrial biogenesis chaperone n=1 Tax=Escherichia coli TaxID=562 RepID=UPI000A68CF9D
MLKMKPALKKTLMAVACLSAVPAAQAAISLDRTRAIFNGGEKSMTLNVANDNKQLPYLAQAWIENEKQEKITTGPVVVTPPVQRLEPGPKRMVSSVSRPVHVKNTTDLEMRAKFKPV